MTRIYMPVSSVEQEDVAWFHTNNSDGSGTCMRTPRDVLVTVVHRYDDRNVGEEYMREHTCAYICIYALMYLTNV